MPVLNAKQKTTISEALSCFEEMKDSLQEKYDAKSEKWQESEVGEAFYGVIESLESVVDSLREIDTDA